MSPAKRPLKGGAAMWRLARVQRGWCLFLAARVFAKRASEGANWVVQCFDKAELRVLI